jgi:hypothetical protein
MEDHEQEQGAVNAPCEVDHPIECQEIQGNLDVGEGGEGPDFQALGCIQSPACGPENQVVEENPESKESDGQEREFGFQQMQSPGSNHCPSDREPANSNKPVDPFYEFLAKEELLLDQLIPGLQGRVCSLFGKGHISSFRSLLQNPLDH